MVVAVALALLVLPSEPSFAETDNAARLLLIRNARHAPAEQVATAYRRHHAAPGMPEVVVDVEVADSMTREAFDAGVQAPVAEWLRQHQAWDRIETLVLLPGLPLRITGTPGRDGTAASLDGELALLYRRLAGAEVPLTGRVPNPYFHDGPLDEPRPFDRARYDIFLVTRLDGWSADEAIALMERGAAPPASWRVVVDGRPAGRSGPERRWLQAVAPRLLSVRPNASVELDESPAVVTGGEPVAGYFSWGSNDSGLRQPAVPVGPGALAATFMSADARTRTRPSAEWQPGRWEQPDSYYAGSPESLAFDWLAAGLTGLGSMVAEPYLDAAFRPATLFEAWARGYSLAESFYLSLPYLSWQAVIFGDPLARATEATWPSPSSPPTDVETGLPETFLARTIVAQRRALGLSSDDDARLWVRSLEAERRGDTGKARALLEELTVREPGLVAAHLRLGFLYSEDDRHDLARARYEVIVRAQPDHAVALNNLAYNLAVQAGDVAAAMPLADRLMRLAPESPAVLDTVGWVRHLAGRHAEAADVLQKATRLDPTLCEAWEHLAIVLRELSRDGEADIAASRRIACEAAQAGGANGASPLPEAGAAGADGY